MWSVPGKHAAIATVVLLLVLHLWAGHAHIGMPVTGPSGEHSGVVSATGHPQPITMMHVNREAGFCPVGVISHLVTVQLPAPRIVTSAALSILAIPGLALLVQDYSNVLKLHRPPRAPGPQRQAVLQCFLL